MSGDEFDRICDAIDAEFTPGPKPPPAKLTDYLGGALFYAALLLIDAAFRIRRGR